MSSKLRRRQKRRQQRRLQAEWSDPTAGIPWATLSRWADPKFRSRCQNPSGVKFQVILVQECEPLFWSQADMVKLLNDMARPVMVTPTYPIVLNGETA